MNIGFITDSLCDLPQSVIEDNDIHIIPTVVKYKNNIIYDDKTESNTHKIYKLINSKQTLNTDANTIEEITIFLTKILESKPYDYIFILTTHSAKSLTYNNCIQAAPNAINLANKKRIEMGYSKSPIIEVIDSQQTSVGLANFVMNAINLSKELDDLSEVKKSILESRKFISSFFIPNDLKRFYFNKKNNNETNIIPLTAYIAHFLKIKPIINLQNNQTNIISKKLGLQSSINYILDYIIQEIHDNKIDEPFIYISYSGPMQELKENAKYNELINLCSEKSIKTFKSNSSGSLAVHLGTRSFFISYIKK